MGDSNFDSVVATTFTGDLTGDVTGNVTGNVTTANVIDLTGLTTAEKALSVPDVASGGVLAAHVTDAITHSIRIQSADGTVYYLMATTTITNRTGGA